MRGEAKLVLYLIHFRFGRVPQRLARRVQRWVEANDAARLYSLAERLLDAATLDDVFSRPR